MKAIDLHVHLATHEWLGGSLGSMREATERHFRVQIPERTIDEMADEFRADDVMAVLLAWDAETATGLPPVTNDYVADCVRRHPDTFVGFASVDPLKGPAVVDELRRAVEDLGLRGLKLHPGCQRFAPNDKRYYPLYEAAVALGIPALFHTGTTGLGAGMPGGGGIKLGYCRPILLDDVAADFPDLQIIAAHPSWPWQDEMLAVAQHKTNVWLELSGWSPRKWSPELAKAVLGPMQDRALYGSDYPFISFGKWLDAFATYDPSPEVQEKILLGNARRLLGL
ncbi:MAG: amidohydrolase family protein [Actinobacteria bacterium]|nr:amidohydrolase family protein [Actinomycetota bacterium]